MANGINFISTTLNSSNGPINFSAPDKYQINRIISEGSQGIVVEAWDSINARRMAIKKLKQNYFLTTEGIKQSYREFVLGAAVQHNNIIRIKEAYTPQKSWTDFRDLYLVFDLMDMNLAQFNAHYRNFFRDPRGADFIASLMKQLLCAVRHLHLERLRLIHRDIKPSNILVRHDNGNAFYLKLADLGSARQLPPDEDETISRYVVTRPYRAPEIILTDSYERPVDLWSVGCVLAELIINRILFDERDSLMLVYCIMQYVGVSQPEIQSLPEFVKQNVLQDPGRFTTNRIEARLRRDAPDWRLSDIGLTELIDLAQRLLVFNPEHRITAEEALALPMWAQLGNEFLSNGNGNGNGGEHAADQDGVYIEDTQHRSFDQWKQVLFNQLTLYNTMMPH